MDQNCNPRLPQIACALGNAAGIVSTILWFLVLVPQLIRNQSRRSVKGLNVLWAIANFSASLCNLLFMFRIKVPPQTQVQAVYMPCLEFLVLIQFWFWWGKKEQQPPKYVDETRQQSNANGADTGTCCRIAISDVGSTKRQKVTFGGACAAALATVWAAVIVTQIFVYDSSSYFAWAAIGLWSVESFPQIYTNLVNPTAAVNGQSVVSILITVFGKTTDSLSAYLLEMPNQTKILAYYSGTSAWINALMVLVVYITASSTNCNEDDDTADANEDRYAKGVNRQDNASAVPVETMNLLPSKRENQNYCDDNCAVSDIPDKLEKNIRTFLLRQTVFRVIVGLILASLIASVVAACFLILHPCVVIAMIGSSLFLLTSFVISLRYAEPP